MSNITIDRAVLDQVVEALERYQHKRQDFDRFADEIAALREALAQQTEARCKYGNTPSTCTSSPMDCQCAIDAALAHPQQEPVRCEINAGGGRWALFPLEGAEEAKRHGMYVRMLYTSPPARKPLTHKEINDIYGDAKVQHDHIPHDDVVRIVRATEAMLNAK